MSTIDEKQKLMDLTNYPKIYAASAFGMSVSDFTKLCKEHGIERWPYHSKKRNEEIQNVPFKTFRVTPQKSNTTTTKKRKLEQPTNIQKAPLISIEDQLRKLEIDTISKSKKSFDSLFPSNEQPKQKLRKMEPSAKQQLFIDHQKLFLDQQKLMLEQKQRMDQQLLTNFQPKISNALPSFKEFLGSVESMKNELS